MSSVQFHGSVDDPSGLTNQVAWRTRPIQADADAAVFDSFVLGVVAVWLAHHQLVSKVFMEMDDAPDLAHASGFQSLFMIVERHLHYGGIV